LSTTQAQDHNSPGMIPTTSDVCCGISEILTSQSGCGATRQLVDTPICGLPSRRLVN